jgi:adenosylcobinamide-GDP ribazoletransferase
VRAFALALQFLSIAPISVQPVAQRELGASMRWFPAVGALLGACVALVDWLLTPLTTPEIRCVLAVALLAVLTGGLHLDGLMDSCDGLFALASPARRLEIMADSRVGSFGLVGAAIIILLKYAAFLALPPGARPQAFIAMGALSRWSMVYGTVQFPAARPEGLGHAYKASAGRPDLIAATLVAILFVVPSGVAGAAALALAWGLAALCGRYASQRIGGLNGDVYGAMSEVVEVAVAVALPPLWRFLGPPLAF